jgi:Cu-processing system ATP-binding protein
MIVTENLSKSYGKVKALSDVSISFNKGEAITLIGPNGSGKTTLIKCLLGLVISDSGNILFDGKKIKGGYQYRNKIGYMPQIGRYPDNMTIAQIFELMLDLRQKKMNEVDHELIHSFGLDSMMSKRMRTLSGGTRQKVSAAIAFMFNPEVLILDEPTAGLDPVASEVLKEKIKKEKELGKLIIVSSHILSDLDELITQIVYLQEGKIYFQKSIEQLRADTGEEKLSKAIASVMKLNSIGND